MRTKASFILLSCLVVCARANPLKDFPLTTDDIFEPLIHSDTDQAAEVIYRQRMRNVYLYELEATNKPHAILHELGTLHPNQINHRFEKDDDKYVGGLLYQGFFALKHELDNPKRITDVFVEIAQNYNARRLQQAIMKVEYLKAHGKLNQDTKLTRIEETEGPIINENTISDALDEFLKDQDIKTIDQLEESGKIQTHPNSFPKVDRQFVYETALKAFKDKIAEGRKMSARILAFRQFPLREATEAFKAMIGYLLHKTISPSEIEVVATRVLNFIHLADMVADPESQATYTAQLGEMVTQKAFAQMANNAEFIQKLVAKVLKTAVHTSRVSVKHQAKKILVAYFTNLDEYEEPTPAYVRLIQRKYSKYGLKRWTLDVSAEYKRMIRIYYLDLLRTSLVAQPDFLDVHSLNQLFEDFTSLIPGYDARQLEVFLALRKMLLKTGDVLDKFGLLSESLYDSFLHAAQYYTSKQPGADVSIPAFYDAYLDEMWGWKNGWLTKWIQWEPRPEDFPININVNYPFFELINLATNFAELTSTKITFHKFQYQNNYPIHMFSTEASPRQFLNFIRLRLFPQGSFNYKHLSERQIPKEIMREYAVYARADRTD